MSASSISKDVTHYSSKSDYLQGKKTEVKALKEVVNESSGPKELPDNLKEKASKVDLSDQAKDKAKDLVKADVVKVGEAAGHLAKDTLSTAKNIPANLLGATPKGALKTSQTTKVVDKNEAKIIPRPGVFFIEGFELFSLNSSKSDGLKAMSESFRGAEHYSWSDEEKIIELIKKRPVDQPIILVGHSLGGDTAVNISNRLNSLEHGFRKVDLLVTLDSIGFDNDIIPQNVSKNLNFISDNDSFFNDSPNIAKNNELTDVINELLPSGHREIDENEDVQFKIFQNMAKTVRTLKEQVAKQI